MSLDQLPDAIFVIDTKKEHIAVTEANKLGLPVVAVVDTNCDPDVITHVIPGQRRRHPLRRPAVPGGGRRRRSRAGSSPSSARPRRPPRRPPRPQRRPHRSRPPRPHPPPSGPGSRRRAGGRRRGTGLRRRGTGRRADSTGRRRPAADRQPAADGRTGRRHRQHRPPRPPRPRRPRRPRRRRRRPRPDRGGLSVPDFTAKDVQKLRQVTGVGMLDAKRALEETGGDIDKAVTVAPREGAGQPGQAGRPRGLRGRGGHRARRRRGRHRPAAVARPTSWPSPSQFVGLVTDELADLVAAEGRGGRRRSAPTRSTTLKITLKENISVGQVVRIEAPVGWRGRLLPAPAGRSRRQRRAWSPSQGGTEELAHDIAVHIAFARPTYLAREDVPEAEVAAERETVEKIARNEGKPEAALPKIVDGRLNGWYKERVPARPVLRQGREADDRQAPRLCLGDGNSPRSSSATEAAVGDRRRIVLKMSGEALASSASDETIDAAVVEQLAVEIAHDPRRARPRAGRDGRRRQHLAGDHRGGRRHGPGHLGHHGHARRR